MEKIGLNRFQQRFWLEEKMNGDNRNNIAMVFRVRGELETGLFRKALEISTGQMILLRSFVAEVENSPCWIPQDDFVLPYWIEDLSELWGEQVIQQRLDSFGHCRFDLATEFSWRVLIVKETSRDYWVEFVFHHICMDLESIAGFLEQLSGVYNALHIGRVEESDRVMHGLTEDLDVKEISIAAKRYWKSYFTDKVKEIVFPLFPGHKAENNQHTSLCFSLGYSLTEAVKQLAVDEQTTVFRILSTAWMWMLSRFSGSPEIMTSYTVNLNPGENKKGIGPFVNNLPFYLDFTEKNTFHFYLQELSRQRRDQKQHQHVIFTDIVSLLRKEQLLEVQEHLMNVCINYAGWGKTIHISLIGADCSFYRRIDVCSGFDLVFEADEADEMHCRISYKTSFPGWFVTAMRDALIRILQIVTNNPSVHFMQVCLLPETVVKERTELANCIASDLNILNTTFFAAFKQTVMLRGEHTAVLFRGTSLTYIQLDKQSDVVANTISKMMVNGQIGYKSPVGICLERGSGMIIAMLGIMKTGVPYVPLDPEYPVERLRFMAADCGITLVITSASHVLKTDFINRHLLLEDMYEPNVQTFPVMACPADRAYIIYTSGTTGNPKGIPIAHYQLLNMAENMQRVFQVKTGDRVLQFASVNFDASVSEIFTCLFVGATLIIASEDERHDPILLLNTIRADRVTHAIIPPAMLTVMQPDGLTDLKTLILAGDTTPPETIARWMEGRTLINAYGPTENTVCATACVMHGGFPANDIGIPFRNVACYVLDEGMNLLPVGVAGELYIGGIQVTEGYINRPELNVEKFVSNPFVLPMDRERNINTRLYRSGDRVRLLPDGHLEFLGRTDFQVKIRGFRIETAEIEACLSRFRQVEQALVTVRETEGEKQLIAYIQVSEVENFSLPELKSFLGKILPYYMIPAQIVLLKEFPLTINGKIDRKKLPVPKILAKDIEHQKPETATEKKLALFWEELLTEEHISRTDQFFRLGGDSIQAIRLALKIAQGFHIEFRVVDVFASPVLFAMAHKIDSYAGERKPEQTDGLKNRALSPVQLDLWIACKKSLAASLAYHVPLLLDLYGDLDKEALDKAINKCLLIQESLRICFPLTDMGVPYLKICDFVYQGLNVENVCENDMEIITTETAGQTFDLENGPLYRFRLLQYDKKKYRILFVCHHLITDGWSVGVLLRQLSSIYNIFQTGRSVDFSPLSYGYLDYACRENFFLDTDDFTNSLFFWRKYLSGCSVLDFDRNLMEPDRQQQVCFDVPQVYLDRIQSYSRQFGVTPFIFFLAVWQFVVARYTRVFDFTTGIVSAGRDDTRLVELAGYFVHLLPIRTVGKKMTGKKFSESLFILTDDFKNILANERVPLSRIPGGAGLIRNLFVWQPEIPDLSLNDLTCKVKMPDIPYAKFDLVMTLDTNNGEAHACLEYAVSAFTAGQIEIIKHDFIKQLDTLTADVHTELALPYVWNSDVDAMVDKPSAISHFSYAGTLEEQRLSYIASGLLNKEQIGVTEDLFDLGLTSLGVMILVNQAEKQGVSLSVSTVYHARTIREIARTLQQVPVYYWHSVYRRDKPVVVLVCGDVWFDSFYRTFGDLLDKDYSLFIIESYHALTDSDIPNLTFDKLAVWYIDVLNDMLYGKSVYAFTGFCIGGEIALALATGWAESEGIFPEVWMLDSFAIRKQKDIPIGGDTVRKTTVLVASTSHADYYPGRVRLVLADNFTDHLYSPVSLPETDECFLQLIRADFEQNAADWEKQIPHIEIRRIDCDHWTFFTPAVLPGFLDWLMK